MKSSRRTKFRITALVVAFAAFLISPELPPGTVFESAQRQSPRPTHNPAGTIATSGTMLTLKLTPDGERPVRVSQLAGGLIKIGKAGKATYGFSPTVSDPASGTVTIKVLLVSKAVSSGEIAWGLEELRTLVVEKAGDKYLTAYYAGSDSGFKIEILNIQMRPPAGDETLVARNHAGASDECCLTCGDRLMCGCAVSTACGGCYDERWGKLF